MKLLLSMLEIYATPFQALLIVLQEYKAPMHMNRKGEIIVIDDDIDDREIMAELLSSLGYSNKIVLLADSEQAFNYLKKEEVKPFMVISDINMPKMNGYQLRDKVLEDAALAEKCIPYLFFTSSGSPETISSAYKRSVHGFFQKINDYKAFKEALKKIVEYWQIADTPVTDY